MAILQLKAVHKIDADNATEQNASRVFPSPNLNKKSDPLDEVEAVIGSDWNFLCPLLYRQSGVSKLLDICRNCREDG
jgi:hypothetical protein